MGQIVSTLARLVQLGLGTLQGEVQLLDRDQAERLTKEQRAAKIAQLRAQLILLEDVDAICSRKDGLFSSAHFSDKVILQQVASSKYQLPLSAHGSGWLGSQLRVLGPCFVALAKAGLTHVQSTSNSDSRTLKLVLLEELDQSNDLSPEIRLHLRANCDLLFDAIREIAESYLARSLPTSKQTGADDDEDDDDLDPELRELNGDLGTYRPVQFLAKGSAGVVYTAILLMKEQKSWIRAVNQVSALDPKNILKAKTHTVFSNLSAQVVLKRIKPTQKDSAENEYRIARKLSIDGGQRYCVAYMDRITDSHNNLWLVIRRVQPSRYGIDLTEYIKSGFFQEDSNEAHAQQMVIQLLQGLNHISSKGVLMRDVKPDNVLVEHEGSPGGDNERFTARWSDFGLSVDLSEQANNLRRPTTQATGKELVGQLVGWWYDTQKQVPKPKWLARTPPERCYQGYDDHHVGAYDVYMTGIIFCCMAFGVDFPHLDKKAIKQDVEEKLRCELSGDYLQTFELGAALKSRFEIFEKAFTCTFGDPFGKTLLGWVEKMLDQKPGCRPTPLQILEGTPDQGLGLSALCSSPTNK